MKRSIYATLSHAEHSVAAVQSELTPLADGITDVDKNKGGKGSENDLTGRQTDARFERRMSRLHGVNLESREATDGLPLDKEGEWYHQFFVTASRPWRVPDLHATEATKPFTPTLHMLTPGRMPTH